jgi:MFS family permease
MNRGVWWRLVVMMVLVYGIQGAFWPLLAVHLQDLGIAGRWRGAIFATLALGALATPLGAGQLVDRRLAMQHYLALIAALGTGVLVVLARGTFVAPGALFGLFLIYWLVTAPATGLSTTLALRNLARPHEQFAAVRLWGTIGWMAAGWMATGVLTLAGSSRGGQGAYEVFGLAAALSALLAISCLALPHTPPLDRAAGGTSALGEAFELVRRPALSVFLATAFGVALTTPFVYQVTPSYFESRGLPRAWIPAIMTLSQYPEIVTLAVLPWLFRRLGITGTLALGIAANALRYATFTLDPPLWVAILGLPLHGVSIACFNVGGQVFLDSQAPAHRRASAQALLMVLTLGVGSLLGSFLAGELSQQFPGDYPRVFLIPFLIGLASLVVFCAGFRLDRGSAAAPWSDPGSEACDPALAPEPAEPS